MELEPGASQSDESRDNALARRLERMVQRAVPGARIVHVRALGADASPRGETAKGGGYGAPLRIDLIDGGRVRSIVLHTATPNEFGHDRRSDRAQQMLLAADTFATIPRHVRVLDVGALRGSDDFVSLAGTGEFYVLTTYAEGRPYAEDLRRIARTGQLIPVDLQRLHILVEYLAALHREEPQLPPTAYVRCIRDTVGGGEGIFGIVDGYPEGVAGVSSLRLERIEERCLSWRHRLKRRGERLARTHGDFHPFNVLFDETSELTLLDTSRGSIGEPADDVSCMAINYPFFSLGEPGAWREALQSSWLDFWRRYVLLTGDDDVYAVAAPFLAWRGLVLSNPKWYPALRGQDRGRILSFVETVLRADRLDPAMADEFFDQ